MTYNSPCDWYFNLPMVLLGLRTAIKSDYELSPIEMVLGSPVRLPGEFFTPLPSNEAWNAHHVLKRIPNFMKNLKAPQTRSPLTCKSYVPKDLTNCSHVWLRIRRVKRPLQPPYIGPYLVLSRHPKYLTIFRDGKSVNVSIDNVKPALDYDQYDDHRQTSFTSNLADISAYSTGQSVGTATPPSSPCHDTKRKRKLPRRSDDYELY